MDKITIEIEGSTFEKMSIELTAEEVRGLYNLRKENALKIAELEKDLATTTTSLKYANENKDALLSELTDCHILLSALGVVDRTTESDDWRRTNLKAATRIALYIAGMQQTCGGVK